MKKILQIAALLLLPISAAFAQPANDACGTATNLGSLPTPAACPSGDGAVSTTAGTTVAGTATAPYPYMIGCSVGTNMQAPAIDVWYTFVATGTVLNINISSTFANPNVGIWTGSCGALTGIDCGIGNAGGNLTMTIGSITPGATYYVQVSGNTTTATGTFTLNLDNDIDCNNCLQTATFTATPAPTNGTYMPGQTVTFCYNVTSYTEVSQNWIHGLQYVFGAGWNMATLTTSPPPQCPYDPPGPGNPANGTWGWYNSVTSSATGLTYGPGFFFEYAGDADANPGNNFGDATNGACTWNFCITITASAVCTPGQSLDITVNTLADGESGSWTSPACSGDPNGTFNAIMNCCGPPTMSSTNVTCNGLSNGTATATPTNTATPWDYVWVNSLGTTVSTSNNIAGPNTASGLPADTYTVTVTDNNGCVSTNTVIITQPAAIVVTPGSNSPVCETQTLNLTANTLGGTYSWTGPNGFSSTLEDPSIIGVTTAAAGVYTVTATVGGCTSAPFTTTVVVNTAANAGTNGTLTTCSNSASTNLFSLLGGSPSAGGTWSGPSALGGGSLGTYNPATATAGVYTYTVTGTAPCPNATATVTVTENAAPNAGTNGTVTFCSNGAAANLFSSLGGGPSAGGTWTGPSALTGGSLGTFTPGTNTAGVYTYTVTGIAPCANATATVTVTVNTAPNAGTNGTATFCSNGAATNLFSSLGGTPAAGGTWTGPSALTGGSLGTFTPGTNTAGVYTYTVTGTAPCANATATITVTVNTAPNAGTNGTATLCSNGAATNLFSSLGGTPVAGGTWTGPSALTGGSLGTFTPGTNTAGTYTYTVTGTAPCVNATATVTVTVNTAPNAGTNGTMAFCTNSPPANLFSFLGGSPTGGGTWSGPSALGGPLGTYDPAINSPGVYTYTVTGTAPCVNATATVTVTENTPPNAGTNGTLTICSNAAATNLFSLLGGGPSAGGTWTGPSALTGGSLGTFTPGTNTAGVYTYTVTGIAPCANATATITVTVNATPTATAGSNTPVCTGQTINLTGNTVVGATYSWTGPNGFTSSLEDPSIPLATALNAGNYTLTITLNGCTSTASVTNVVVTNATDATITPAGPFCTTDPATTLIAATAGGTWSATCGACINAATGSFNPSTSGAGSFTVTYTISGSCGNTDTETIVVNATPTATAGSNSPICEGQTLDLTANTVAGATYSWTGPNGFTSSSEDPSISNATPAESGNYDLTITIGGCSANSTVAVTVSAAPVANAGGDVYLCNGQSATLNATGTGTPVWVPSTGLSSAVILNPVTSASTTTIYVLTLTIGSCTDTDSVTVNVSTPSPLTVSNDTSICIGDCVTFNVSGADYYAWSPSTGLTDTTAATQSVCPAATITYDVTGYTVSVNAVANGDFESGNTAFTSDYIFTTPPNGGEGEYWVATGPQVSTWNGGMTSAGDNTTGTGNLLIVNGAGTPGNNVWCQTIVVQPGTDYVFSTWVSSFNTGSLALLQFSINGVNLSTPFSAPNTTNTWVEFFATWNSGTDTVATICIVNQNTSLGGNDFGLDDIFFSAVCETTEQITITVNTTTDATITPAGPFCANTPSVTLNAATAGGTWTGTGITNGTTGAFDPAIAGAGTHTIIYTIPGSCGDADTTTITVNALPVADAGADTLIGCNPSSIQLDGSGSTGGASISWTTVTGNIVNGGTTTTPTIDQPGTYFITVTQNGCTDSDTVVVTLSNPPSSSFTVNPSTGYVPLVVNTTNNSTGTGLTYSWDLGNGTTSTSVQPTTQYDTAGTYIVTLIVTDAFGCTDTSSITIIVFDEFQIIIPNVFSPNGDGANDVFEVFTQGVTDLDARIYNRWGQQVGNFAGITGYWDGKKDGTDCPSAVYYYVITITKANAEVVEFTGHVTLLR